MARATWTGYISFGLVNVPVKLFTAVRSHRIHFRQLNADTHNRVTRKRVDVETGEEVDYDDIVKGWEADPGRYVIVDPDELEQLDPEGTRMIDIQDFVELSDIDPIYYDRPYYLAPADESARKPYRLLVEAMERQGKVGIATFVMRQKAYLGAIRAKDGLLVLSTMNYADEVVDRDDLEGSEEFDVEVDEREVAMAEQLIDSLVTDFDPSAYRDTYTERLRDFLESKAEGEAIEIPEPSQQPGAVVDLMAALEESLQTSRNRGRRRDLGDLTKDELYEMAQTEDIDGRSSMSKEELVEALDEAS